MKRILVASSNPVKLRAVLTGFQSMFPGQTFEVSGQSVESGVSEQPTSDAETLQGAAQRAARAAGLHPQADFWVGVEGGVEQVESQMAAFAWVVVRSARQEGQARTATFFLPHEVARLVSSGVELGAADDLVFGRTNSKQENGAIGLLTGDVVDRARLYEQAVILALVPFKNEALYPSKDNSDG